MGLDRKMVVTHTAATSAQPGTTGLSEGKGDLRFEKSQKATPHSQPATVSHTEKRIHSTQRAPESQIIPVVPGKDSEWFLHESSLFSVVWEAQSYSFCLKTIKEIYSEIEWYSLKWRIWPKQNKPEKNPDICNNTVMKLWSCRSGQECVSGIQSPQFDLQHGKGTKSWFMGRNV